MQQSRPTQPTKEQTRAYLQERQRANTPPPSIEEIRRQLGWGLVTPLAR